MIATTSRPLRDYQARCIDLTYEAMLSPSFSGYYTLPTGTGKTRIATGLIEKLSQQGRVLVVAHRKELIEQMAAAIREDVPWRGNHSPLTVGVMMAERNQFACQVVVGSIQTLSSDRLSLLLRPGEELWKQSLPIVAILIDECHHVQKGNSYDTLIQAVRSVYPACAVIGCTATPYRSDTKPMQDVLPTCTFSRTIPDMQEAGWLAPVTWQPIKCDLDTSKLRTSSIGGEKDYNAEDIEEQLFPQSVNIVEKTIPLIENRPTVVFAATVRHAQELAFLYRDAGIVTASIWGDMPKANRDDILRSWKEGRIQIVVNVGILTEGFDYTPLAPNTEGLAALVIARPTMSPSLYLQMLGRGTRLKPGSYKDCLIIDVVGNANLLETRQISLPKVMPTHTEEQESGSHIAINDPDRPKQPQVLKINGPFEKSWAAWGLRDGIYYSGINRKAWAVLVPDARGSGLYEGYVLSKHYLAWDEEVGEVELEKYEKGCKEQWLQERITARPGTLADMMTHLNAIYAQNGAKALVDKKAQWRWDPPTDAALQMLSWKAPDQSFLAKKYSWNAGQVSLAIDYAVLQPHLARLRKGE